MKLRTSQHHTKFLFTIDYWHHLYFLISDKYIESIYQNRLNSFIIRSKLKKKCLDQNNLGSIPSIEEKNGSKSTIILEKKS